MPNRVYPIKRIIIRLTMHQNRAHKPPTRFIEHPNWRIWQVFFILKIHFSFNLASWNGNLNRQTEKKMGANKSRWWILEQQQQITKKRFNIVQSCRWCNKPSPSPLLARSVSRLFFFPKTVGIVKRKNLWFLCIWHFFNTRYLWG